MRYVAAFTAACLASVVAASAQQPAPGGGTGKSETQCWDTSTNTVKSQAPGANTTTGINKQTGGAPSSSSTNSTSSANSPSGTVGKGTSTDAVVAAGARPVGMPNC